MSKVVHISEAASIAIHSMAIIASSPEKLNAKQLARLTGASLNHLSKVMQMLVKGNYLQSNRGPAGGFILNRPADEVSLLEIYELIEGSIDCSICGISDDKCPFEKCVFGDHAFTFSEEFREYLYTTRISDLTTKKHIYATKDHSD